MRARPRQQDVSICQAMGNRRKAAVRADISGEGFLRMGVTRLPPASAVVFLQVLVIGLA
jgi:hypothetical protein